MSYNYKPTHINTQTTTVIESAAKNITVHTISFPKATSGTVTLQSGAGVTYTGAVYPIGSIGSIVLDASFPVGLQVVTSAADMLVVTTNQP